MYMQAYCGLPKNIPQNKIKPKILLSIGSNRVTPRRGYQSPQNSLNKSTNSQTPQTSPLSKRYHQLKSKQKPFKPNSFVLYSKQQCQSIVDDDINYHDRQINYQYNKSAFYQSDNRQSGSNTLSDIRIEQQNRKLGKNKKNQSLIYQLNNQQSDKVEINQLKYNQISTDNWTDNSQNQAIKIKQNNQILRKCGIMLKNYQNWSQYNGELINKKKTGYGILYFKNKDKFMGAFKDDKASGHGTYYDYQIKRRVMGVFQDNQITYTNQIIIQKI